MNKRAKIYIAGHQGMVGSAFLRRLKELGYKNIIIRDYRKLDLRNQKATENLFKKERPTHVFLAAAKVGGILANATFKAEFIYDNIMISSNVIHFSYKYRVKKLLNLGSSCIYPKFSPQPMKEKYLLSDTLEPTNEPYAIAKIAAIKLCRYYNEQYGTNFTSVMPTNMYGPGDNYNLETGHMLAAFIRKFNLAKLLQNKDFEELRRDIKRYPLGFGLDKKISLKKEDSIRKALKSIGITSDCVTLWGSGKPYHEFMCVEDLANASIFLMKKYNYKDIGEFVNVGTGKDLRVREIAELVKNTVGFKGKIRWDTSKFDGTPRKLLDVSKINKLGWKAKINLKEGIKKSYRYYKDRKPI
ncbi:MAG: GDP-L-fucose synthase [Candidatus Omnitrophota bacterium]|nr:MAG: GDP-L-fucose synthase [Candidatus Omnitrophota bacterium]